MFVAALPGCGANTAMARLHATADHDDILDIANSSFHKSSADFENAFSVGRNKSAPLHVLPVAVPDAELSRHGKRLGEFAPPRRSARGGAALMGSTPWLCAKGLALSGRYLAGRLGQRTSAASLPNSSGKYARTVVVRTLPRDVKATANLVIASPSGISSTRTTSY